jgi:hypothetical protein
VFVSRREYKTDIVINEIRITQIIIDPHFEEKHKSSINDEIIIRIVENMDGGKFTAESVSPPFKYYKRDRIFLDGKYYKLIWLLEEGQIYIGVVNAYRR